MELRLEVQQLLSNLICRFIFVNMNVLRGGSVIKAQLNLRFYKVRVCNAASEHSISLKSATKATPKCLHAGTWLLFGR